MTVLRTFTVRTNKDSWYWRKYLQKEKFLIQRSSWFTYYDDFKATQLFRLSNSCSKKRLKSSHGEEQSLEEIVTSNAIFYGFSTVLGNCTRTQRPCLLWRPLMETAKCPNQLHSQGKQCSHWLGHFSPIALSKLPPGGQLLFLYVKHFVPSGLAEFQQNSKETFIKKNQSQSLHKVWSREICFLDTYTALLLLGNMTLLWKASRGDRPLDLSLQLLSAAHDTVTLLYLEMWIPTVPESVHFVPFHKKFWPLEEDRPKRNRSRSQVTWGKRWSHASIRIRKVQGK